MLLQQAGILEHAMRKFVSESKNNPCFINQKNVQKNAQSRGKNSVVFKLKDFSGAFAVLGAGLALALATFVGEIIVPKNRRVKLITSSERHLKETYKNIKFLHEIFVGQIGLSCQVELVN